jgi:hypothetical protein
MSMKTLFHSGNRGSNPLGDATIILREIKGLQKCKPFFYACT